MHLKIILVERKILHLFSGVLGAIFHCIYFMLVLKNKVDSQELSSRPGPSKMTISLFFF